MRAVSVDHVTGRFAVEWVSEAGAAHRALVLALRYVLVTVRAANRNLITALLALKQAHPVLLSSSIPVHGRLLAMASGLSTQLPPSFLKFGRSVGDAFQRFAASQRVCLGAGECGRGSRRGVR